MSTGVSEFELHTLGWRAFQDLCVAVVRTVWGHIVSAFADSNDAGRDGAFYGIWEQPRSPQVRGRSLKARSSCSVSTRSELAGPCRSQILRMSSEGSGADRPRPLQDLRADD